jgi:hypothetical protein
VAKYTQNCTWTLCEIYHEKAARVLEVLKDITRHEEISRKAAHLPPLPKHMRWGSWGDRLGIFYKDGGSAAAPITDESSYLMHKAIVAEYDDWRSK